MKHGVNKISNRRRSRRVGFLGKMKTRLGRELLKRRRRKGRTNLTTGFNYKKNK